MKPEQEVDLTEQEREILTRLSLAGFFQSRTSPGRFTKCPYCKGWGYPGKDKEFCFAHYPISMWGLQWDRGRRGEP